MRQKPKYSPRYGRPIPTGAQCCATMSRKGEKAGKTQQKKSVWIHSSYRRACRLIFTLAALSTFIMSTHADAQIVGDDLQFPYQAIVLNQDAAVRSGPGQVHYATGKLDQNSTVEVYRHDPGGWCAVRPPNASFSLVPEAAIEIIEDGLGRISENGTQAWVGTQLGPVEQPLWQIKLKSGEIVDILGQASWPNPEGHSTVWYQIAPPAGEFRWVHIADLQLPPSVESPEANLAENRRRTTEPSRDIHPLHSQPLSSGPQFHADATMAGASPVQPANYQSYVTGTSEPRIETINQGWRQASRPIDRRGMARQENSALTGERIAALPIANSNRGTSSYVPPNLNWSNERMASTQVDPRFDLEQLRPSALQDKPVANRAELLQSKFSLAPTGFSSSQPLTARLTELELKLNNEMIKEPNQWRLIDVQTTAQSILDGTTDPVERLQAERLLSKLENCRKIRTDYQKVFPVSAAGNAEGAIGAGFDEEFSINTIYDAHGWLNELVRDGGTQHSTYVLQDDSGKITHHISPTPGLNLTVYLKTKVGIVGKRGYHTGLKLDHVTAERVIELKD